MPMVQGLTVIFCPSRNLGLVEVSTSKMHDPNDMLPVTVSAPSRRLNVGVVPVPSVSDVVAVVPKAATPPGNEKV